MLYAGRAVLDGEGVSHYSTTIPLTGGGKVRQQGRTASGGLPGWVEVQPYQQESVYWHWVWLGQGQHSTGPVHDTMVRTRTQYHYAVRRCRRQSDETRAKREFELSLCVTKLEIVDYRQMVRVFVRILIPEGHKNSMTSSKVTTIFAMCSSCQEQQQYPAVRGVDHHSIT